MGLDAWLCTSYNDRRRSKMSESNEGEPKNPNMDEARQHMKAARDAMHQTMEAWLPKGYVENRRKARKEFLLAMRSLLDAAINHVEEKSKSVKLD
jgi:hypothetical protein